MSYIVMELGEIITKGNFAFIFESTKNKRLFNSFLEAEQIFKISYIDFSHKIRLAYETFALFEEVQRRKQLPEYTEKSEANIEAEIVSEITTPASILNYKNIIIGLCKNRTTEFECVFTKYEYNKNIESDFENRRVMNIFIRHTKRAFL